MPDKKAELRSKALSALKNYHKEGTIRDRYAPALGVLVAESDRGAIILVAGIFDDMLGERIVARLPNGKANRESLLAPGGVLGWFQDRMTMALAMGLIDQETFDDIELIRVLRNKCAHTIGPVSLAQSPFNEVLALLVDPLTSEDISGGKVSDIYLRNILSFMMVFLIERLLGKSKEDAEQTVTDLASSMMQPLEPSPDKHPRRSALADRRGHTDEKL